jgi:hypothetical protein
MYYIRQLIYSIFCNMAPTCYTCGKHRDTCTALKLCTELQQCWPFSTRRKQILKRQKKEELARMLQKTVSFKVSQAQSLPKCSFPSNSDGKLTKWTEKMKVTHQARLNHFSGNLFSKAAQQQQQQKPKQSSTDVDVESLMAQINSCEVCPDRQHVRQEVSDMTDLFDSFEM